MSTLTGDTPRRSPRLAAKLGATTFVFALSACATDSRTQGDIAQGAAGGAALGAVAGAVVPGVSVIEGAAVGAAIGGVAGYVWADQNNDGYVDGYVSNGQYYAGTPQGYDPTLRRVATGAVGGAALGAAAGALIPGHGILEGAVIGAAVGGVAGAVWADRDNDGRVDGYVSNGQYYPGVPGPAPLPNYTAPSRSGERDGAFEASGEESDPSETESPASAASGGRTTFSSQRYAAGYMRARLAVRRASATAYAAHPGFSAIRAWHTNNGALTEAALNALVEECSVNWGGVDAECQAAVSAGSGNFGGVPKADRKEFAYLLQQSCPADRNNATCVRKMRTMRILRSLPKGRLDPKPLRMNEGETTRFTAFVMDIGEGKGQPGLATDLAIQPAPPRQAAPVLVPAIPISSRMCFALAAEDKASARIEPIGEGDAKVEQGRICMNVAEGGGTIKFDPSWNVTPLSGRNLRLLLDTEHVVGDERKQIRYQPRPITVEVIPKKGLWDRLDEMIKRLTGTVGLLGSLATAIGGLIASIAAWKIWGLFKRRRAGPTS
jgi:hypothetical protein